MAKKVIERDSSNTEAGVVSFTVIDSGQKLECDARVVFGNVYDKFTDVGKRLVLHAINAKVGDAAAAPDSDRFEAMKSTWDNLVNGTWAVRGEGGAGRVTLLEEAAVRATGKTLEAVRNYIAGLSEDDKKALNNHEQIKAAKADIKAEKAAAAKKAASKAAKDAAPLTIPD